MLPEEIPGVCTTHVKPPDPVLPTKVAHPWKPGEFLAGWSGLLYSDVVYAALDEAKLEALCEAMAVDGGNNARRWFAFYADVGTSWAGTGLFPWNADWSWNEAYWAQLDRRVNMWAGKRDGTEIISIIDACSMYEDSSWLANPLNKLASRPAEVFWPGPARDKVVAFALELAKRTARFGERIILETRNEGDQIVGPDALYEYDTAIISALIRAGWPRERIQVEWYDAGLYFDEISLANYLNGQGLAATHRICSPEDLSWYETSPGKQALAALGDHSSSDGSGFAPEAPQGLFWAWLPSGLGRRPSAPQARNMTATARALGLRGIEFLSAAAFQKGEQPNLEDAITIGRGERLAMKAK
jgi:hypothetical protein